MASRANQGLCELLKSNRQRVKQQARRGRKAGVSVRVCERRRIPVYRRGGYPRHSRCCLVVKEQVLRKGGDVSSERRVLRAGAGGGRERTGVPSTYSLGSPYSASPTNPFKTSISEISPSQKIPAPIFPLLLDTPPCFHVNKHNGNLSRPILRLHERDR
jgi:hypothetical protein